MAGVNKHTRPSGENSRPIPLLVFNLYKWFLYIASSILLLVALMYILGQVLTHKPIDYPSVAIAIIPSCCMLIFVVAKKYLSFRRDRKQ